MIKTLLALLCFAVALPAQMSFFEKDPVDVFLFQGDLVAVHADNSMTFTDIDGLLKGDPVQSTADEVLPILKTEWVDAKGVTHSVTTPVVTSTTTGFVKTLKKHQERVDAMQKIWPPRKC